MKIGVVTDTHLTYRDRAPASFHNIYDYANNRANLQRALERHLAAGVDAVAMLGDLANNGDDPHHHEGLELLAASGLPVWIVPGNHDCEQGVTKLAERSAERTSIAIPQPAGGRSGSLRIAGLPTASYDTDARWTLAEPEIDAWGDDPALLVTHAPVISRAAVSAEAELRYAGDVGNHARIAEIVKSRIAPTVVIHGHLHLRDAVTDGSVLQIGFASIIEAPHECAVLELVVEDQDLIVRVQHHAVAPSAVERLPVLAPERSLWRFSSGVWSAEEASE